VAVTVTAFPRIGTGTDEEIDGVTTDDIGDDVDGKRPVNDEDDVGAGVRAAAAVDRVTLSDRRGQDLSFA